MILEGVVSLLLLPRYDGSPHECIHQQQRQQQQHEDAVLVELM